MEKRTILIYLEELKASNYYRAKRIVLADTKKKTNLFSLEIGVLRF